MKAAELLSRDEIRELTRPSDLRGALSVLVDYAWFAASFALVALVPNPLTIAIALAVIGGRQLGLAVLGHECAHRSLFSSRLANDVVGLWLCGSPIWFDPRRYRVHHQAHHSLAGTPEDPDAGLVEPFPTTRASLVRKLARDLVGATGLRRVVGQLAMDLGFLSYSASTGQRRNRTPSARALLGNAARYLGPVALSNGVLLGLLTAAGHPALYGLWVGAWLTTYSVALRIRAIAEHACTEPDLDPLRHTRTTLVSWPERLLLAPHHVSYHVEHHLLMTVPHWRLPELHRRLLERGAFGPGNLARGYAAVLRSVTV